MGLFEKIKNGLKKSRDSIGGKINSMLSGFRSIDEELFEELEELLILSDIGVGTTGRIIDELKKQVKLQNIKDPMQINEMLRKIITDMISGGEEMHLSTKPSVVLVIGVNGVGKTTTIGKLAAMYVSGGKKVVLAAADTFRAAAIEQLTVWAERSGADIISHAEGSDPASVVFDAISSAKAKGADIVLCDTAGRLHNKKNLMAELQKINRIIDRELPDADKEILLVLDAATGQNAISQAKEFRETADITGIVLTKLDGTPKGGVIIPIREELKIPVKFIGVGEQVDDLQPFDAETFAQAIFEKDGDNL